MITALVMTGSAVVGEMETGPPGGMLNTICGGPAPLVFASRIACRNEPAPLSLVVVTEKIAASAWQKVPSAMKSVRMLPEHLAVRFGP